MKSARGLADGSARGGAVSIRLRRVDDGAGRLPRESFLRPPSFLFLWFLQRIVQKHGIFPA